jgi:hypothetical protein
MAEVLSLPPHLHGDGAAIQVPMRTEAFRFALARASPRLHRRGGFVYEEAHGLRRSIAGWCREI